MRRSSRFIVAASLGASAVIVAAGAADARPGPPSQPVVSVADAVADENDGMMSFEVTLDRPAPKDLTVRATPLPGTARPARDYRPGSVSTVVPRGATSATIGVPIFGDAEIRPDRSFTLRLTATPGASVGVRDAAGLIRDGDPLTINILHINDHHSHIDPVAGALNVGTSGGSFNVPFGGFPRLTTLFGELEAELENPVKVHAGDAITGTLYYTLFKGLADAQLMNTVCFDMFALGNHEFDDGDASLAQFLDWLADDPNCDTAVLGANIVPKIGTPLAPITANDYIQPYVIKEFDGQQVGFIGIDIAQKTQVSSQPFPTTEFLDEVETTQFYVDELSAMGIDNIVVVTHYTYQNDLALAAAVTGVDAIVGGDSHTLLSNTLNEVGLAPNGPYPTVVTNADGEQVCVVQAWQYGWAVGQLEVGFRNGVVESCGGEAMLVIGDTITRSAPIPAAELAEIRSILDARSDVRVVAPDPAAQALRNSFAAEIDVLNQQVIGSAAEPICDRRVPNRVRTTPIAGCSPTNDDPDVTAASGAKMAVNGGFIQQVVTDSFLARAFRSDLAIQNAGGVRRAFGTGPITIGAVYELLPFSNTLVELELTGAEVVTSIEEGVRNFVDRGGSDGAYPYGSAIRWDVDLNRPFGERFTNVEVRDRTTGQWSPIVLDRTYVVVTNSFMAGGGDGYETFRRARDEGRVRDTFINYAQGFYDYIIQDLGGGAISVPAPENFSTQRFTPRTT
jgi:5'-nucleotidase / UDP-sugar diphosphatase